MSGNMKGVRETATILDQIVAQKKLEVEAARRLRVSSSDERVTPSDVRATSVAAPRLGFATALRASRPGRPIIAEIKKASPSAGVIREPFDPEAIARAYESAGARCISVITDEKFFRGSLDVLRRVRAVTSLPIIRKDFIIDWVQLAEAVEVGADAALLIARILDDELMADLYAAATEMGLDVLIEVHDAPDLERVSKLSPRPQLIGVNNRDLADFTVSIDRTLRLLPLVPPGALLVSESGLSDSTILDALLAAGAGAFLIGTSLMKADDPEMMLRRLVG